MTDLVLDVEKLSRTFSDFWGRPVVRAVDGLTFGVNRGEIIGLLGPNGSGKSTTIKMLLGLLRPTSGGIRVMGAPATDTRTKARVGYLPEVTHLHGFLTPLETLDYYASLFGQPAAERRRRAVELLEMTGLSHAARRPVAGFSKGMARRVALAQALVNAPELLILDEPTSGLDPVACREVKDLIAALAKLGMTVLMSSHLLGDVEDICDRVLILDKGKLRAEGRVADLLRCHDRTRFTLKNLPGPDARALRAELEKRYGEVEVDHAELRLESYFLNVVRDGSAGTFHVPRFIRDRGGA
ncbi:MAG: ABC transporter ATP-binding protein [Kiritimatiellaeota bacterium]|nr:ABC transporter ATP-binding protein [Kiritimatiellota bacterium]